jgi:hypothetical protein
LRRVSRPVIPLIRRWFLVTSPWKQYCNIVLNMSYRTSAEKWRHVRPSVRPSFHGLSKKNRH